MKPEFTGRCKRCGNFQQYEIAQLYQELFYQGNTSLPEAYQVGLQIEMVDIEDLTKRIAFENKL